MPPKPTNYTFQQNSHSGPGIAAFTKFLQDGRWCWKNVSPHSPGLNLACDHKAREQMFYTTIPATQSCFILWGKKSQGNKDWIQPPETLVDEMQIPPFHFQWVRNLSLIFLNQSSRCKACQIDTTSDHTPVMKVPYLPTRIAYPHSKITTPHLPHPLSMENAEELFSSSGESSNEDIDFGNFDDYNTAPMWSGTPPPLFNVWTFESSGFQALPNFATTWRDRGYRLPPYFAQVSPKRNPTDFISCLLPTIGHPTQKGTEFVGSPLSSRSSSPEATSLGAKGMLDEAGRIPKTQESYNVFVRGKTRADNFLKLDLEQDHIALTPEQISISTDIDSILFVTTNTLLSCKGAVNLHLLPHFADQPPFSANPSVYVTLLEPPGNEMELNNPHSRGKVQYPLSSIPHIPFGYFGEASQQFNLYVFFPRMIHKNTNNNRAITILPHELQELWISETIFKALASALGHYHGVAEYLPHSTEQLRWKTGDRARRPTIPLAPQSLASLLVAIRHEVSQNDDLLSCFGSFFFVLDARGIKLLSKQCGPEETPFQALQRVVPGLDWNYMLDRTNGELYLDLGVSFHPTNTTEPMVGLWRLDSLRSSYVLMGKSSRNSKEYHYNTMRDYGGFKAETSGHVKHHTHIVKRISYNLFFESVRQPGQQAYITSLDNAIRCNQKYLDGCTRWAKALVAGTKHSYGVRDELPGFSRFWSSAVLT